MTGPLEALESLVANWRTWTESSRPDILVSCADELEPIIQQLKERLADVEKDYVGMREFQLRFIGADQERRYLLEERKLTHATVERYREALEAIATASASEMAKPWLESVAGVARRALQASSSTIRADEAVGVFEGLAGAPVPVAKDSDTPECPRCGFNRDFTAGTPKIAGTYIPSQNCTDPFHTPESRYLPGRKCLDHDCREHLDPFDPECGHTACTVFTQPEDWRMDPEIHNYGEDGVV